MFNLYTPRACCLTKKKKRKRRRWETIHLHQFRNPGLHAETPTNPQLKKGQPVCLSGLTQHTFLVSLSVICLPGLKLTRSAAPPGTGVETAVVRDCPTGTSPPRPNSGEFFNYSFGGAVPWDAASRPAWRLYPSGCQAEHWFYLQVARQRKVARGLG